MARCADVRKRKDDKINVLTILWLVGGTNALALCSGTIKFDDVLILP